MRINQFNNVLYNQGAIASILGAGTLFIQGHVIPGSLSFNNVIFLVSQASTAASITVSFGLYSLNGSTLSLANSASKGTNFGAGLSWMSLITSANQDITPGNWFLALLSTTAGNANISFYGENVGVGFSEGVNAGNFVNGIMSVTTNGLPATIATSDLVKFGAATWNNTRAPYVIISS